MNIMGNIAPWILGRKPKFVPPAEPTAVSFQSLTANGTSGTVSTTQLTATFDVDPGLTTANFVVTGASKGVVSKVGAVYTVNINTITVEDGQGVTLDIINVPSGFTVTPLFRSVTVYKAAALEAPTFEFDLVFPQLTEGDTGTFSAAYCFAGEIDSYSIATGTLPAWLTFNTSTCVFTYTNAVFETVSGLSITATNAAGSAATNTADWVVAEIDAMPLVFHGYTQVNGTSIQVTELKFQDSVEERILAGTLEAPCSLMITAEAVASGVLRHTGKPVSAYRHAHYETKVTYANGDPIEYLGEVKKVHKFGDESVVNPYTDTPGPEITALIRKDGDYRVETTVMLANSTGNVIKHVFSRNVTINPCGADFYFYAGSSGNDSNDGRDPNGFALTNASYVESTGVLTETGKFAGYDHTAAASIGYDRENTNWIYFSGALRRIAEKISDDAIRIDDAYKLSADATGLTSSTGPKGFYTGGNPQADNFGIMLLSGTTSDFASSPSTASVDDWFYMGSYGGTSPANITSTTMPPRSRMISMQLPNGTNNLPNNIYISNIRLPDDGKILFMFSGVSFSDPLEGQQVDICLDRMVDENIGNWYIPSSADIHLTMWATQCLANQRMITFERTIEAALTGDVQITLETAFDPAEFTALNPGATYASIKIYYSPTEYEYHRMSLTSADNLTFDLISDRGRYELLRDFPAGSAVTIHESRSVQQLITSKRLAIVGMIIESTCDFDTYGHHYYPNNQIGNSHYGWVYARDGENVGFMFNHNADDVPAQDGISVHDCYCRHSEFFIDSSNGANKPETSTQTNMILYRNKGDETCRGGTMYPWTLKSFFAKKMEFYNDGSTYDGIVGVAYNSFQVKLDTLVDHNVDNYVAEECRGFGYGLYKQEQFITTELYNNEVWSNAADATLLRLSPSASGYSPDAKLYVGYNKFWAPNVISGKPFTVDGVAKTLAELESLIPGDNNSLAQPDWNDPANGDFSPVVTSQAVTFNGVDSYASISPDMIVRDGVTGIGDWVQFEVKTTTGGVIVGESASADARVEVNSTGVVVRTWISPTTFNYPKTGLLDGNWHTIRIQRDAADSFFAVIDGETVAQSGTTSITANIRVNRVARRGTIYTNASVRNLTVSGSVLTTYAMDSGSTTTEAASVGTGTMTLVNVVAGDWT